MNGTFKFVGLFIADNDDAIVINQTDYIELLEADFDVIAGNKAEPMNTYKAYDKEEVDQSFRVKSIIGSLRFVADRTRPDIAFAVEYLSRFADFPSQLLMDDCLKVSRINLRRWVPSSAFNVT